MNAKTIARIESVVNAAKSDPDTLYAHVAWALREQDKVTRHACAEAVSAISTDDYGAETPPHDLLSRAHSACMNVQAI